MMKKASRSIELQGKAGGVQMEYVVILLLVGVAVVLAVAVFGRSLMSGSLGAGDAMLGQPDKAVENLEMRRGDRNAEKAIVDQYHQEITGAP